MTTESLAAMLVRACRMCLLSSTPSCPTCHGTGKDLTALLRHLSEQAALLALILDRLEEAGGTLDHKLRHQIVMDLQQDIRQGGENAAQWWLDKAQEQAERIKELERERDAAQERNRLLVDSTPLEVVMEIGELRDRLARAESDTKRLDWLIYRITYRDTKAEQSVLRLDAGGPGRGASAREAIDAAIAKSQPQERSNA